MRHRLVHLLAIVAVSAAPAGLQAADAAPSQPLQLASAVCPDLARSRVRWAQSLWGRIWALPALAPARAFNDQQYAELAKRIGLDPNVLFNDAASAEGVVVAAAPTAQPLPAARVRFPTTIAAVMRALAARPGAVAGADGVVTLGDASCRRDGEWLVIGAAGQAPVGPPPVQPLEADSDLSGVVDFTALARLLPPDPAQKKRDPQRTLAALGISTMRFHMSFAPEGTRELIEYPGARLPLAPLDPAALAALPESPLALYAAGLDGAKLAVLVKDVVQSAGDDADGLAEFDRRLAAFKLPPVLTILAGLRGTAWLAVVNGAPFPTVTLAVPATPEVDACVEALAVSQGVDLANARTEAVPLPLLPRVPVLVAVRRTATHWVVGSDAALLERLGAGQPGGYAPPAAEAGALPALATFSLDLRGLGQLLLAYLPLIANTRIAALPPAEQQEQRKFLASLQQGLVAAIPLLVPSIGTLTQPPLGATVTARNAYIVVPFLAGMSLPVIGQVRAMANQQKSGKNLSQLAGAIIAYQTSEDKNPKTLAEVVAAEHLPAALLVSPSAPDIANPYLYIRSIEDVAAAVPLLIEDPACNKGRGTMVCYGDSHTKFIKGPAALRLWTEAKRLAASPKAAADGIALEDWAAVYDILGVDPAEVAPAEPTPAAKPEAAPIP